MAALKQQTELPTIPIEDHNPEIGMVKVPLDSDFVAQMTNNNQAKLQEENLKLKTENSHLLADLQVANTVTKNKNSSTKYFWESKKVLVTFLGLIAIIISEQFGVSQDNINSVLEFVIKFIPETAIAGIVGFYIKNQSEIDKKNI